MMQADRTRIERELLDIQRRKVAILQREADARKAAPLAHARLWHRAAPRTSQREAAQAMLSPTTRYGFAFGGNRSGKSEMGGQLATAYALGSDHPDVQAWGALNRLNLSSIPHGPGTVWAVALTFGDSRRYVREKLKRYAPAGSTFRAWDAENEAELRYPNGGKVVCKAWAQTQAGMQGDSIRLLWSDEEPDDKFAWNEALMRLVDQDGRAICTMTPLHGRTWVHARYVERPPDGAVLRWLHGTDNPHVPTEVLQQILSGFGEEEQAARARGEFTMMEGLIYSTYRRHMHVVPSFPIPKEWRRWRSIDFGTRNPFCCLWGALDGDDRLHIYRIHYEAGQLLTHHAARIHDLSGAHATAAAIRSGQRAALPPPSGEDFVSTVADPEDAGARKTLAAELGITTRAAIKDVTDGIRVVQERMRPQVDSRPSIFIHDCCTELINEIEGYIWADNARKEQPVKENDHALDALRYLCMEIHKRSQRESRDFSM